MFIDDKILVYRRDHKTNNFPGLIDLPGGGRENNESPFETFQREVKEEFGIIVNEEELVFSCEFQSIIDRNKKSFFIVVKTKRFSSADIILGDEGIEWFLITPEDFINRSDGINHQQDRVRKYLSSQLKNG